MPPKLLDDGRSVEENNTHEDHVGNPRDEESSSNLEHFDMSRSYGRGEEIMKEMIVHKAIHYTLQTAIMSS